MSEKNDNLTPQEVEEATSYVRSKVDFPIQAAIVLGSGLGPLADKVEQAVKIPYNEIPNFPKSTVEGHAGQLIFGFINDTAVALMKGRFHFYEGHHPSRTVMGIRLFAAMQIKSLILTNAAGAANSAYRPGDIMLINDHINLLNANPLTGPHYKEWGARFVDMSNVYDEELRKHIQKTAKEKGLVLRSGIYAAMAGPTYETPAEIQMLRILGADAAGMSTVHEAIIGSQAGMRILGLSLITNMGAGLEHDSLNHDEVIEIANQKFPELESMVHAALAYIDAE